MKIFKRISTALVLCMTTAIYMPLTANAAITDIQGHWAQAAIESWLQSGLISGYPDGSFQPDAPISRAEFVVLVNKAFAFHNQTAISFSDVPDNHWAYIEIQKGVAEGYISGDATGAFRPDSPVMRQEAAVMLAQVKNITTNMARAENYADASQIPAWSKGYVGAVSQYSIMTGFPDGTFCPSNTMTRAEGVIALSKAIGATIGENVGAQNSVKQDTIDSTNAPNIATSTWTGSSSGRFGSSDSSSSKYSNLSIDNSNKIFNGKGEKYNTVTINVADAEVKDIIVYGNLVIAEEVGNGTVNLSDLEVKGDIKINTDKENAVVIENCSIQGDIIYDTSGSNH